MSELRFDGSVHIPPNPYDRDRAPRNWVAWNVACSTAAFRWTWTQDFCAAVADRVRAMTGQRIQHESVMHSLSEFRRHLEPVGVEVLRYRGRLCLCPAGEVEDYKARVA